MTNFLMPFFFILAQGEKNWSKFVFRGVNKINTIYVRYTTCLISMSKNQAQSVRNRFPGPQFVWNA